MGKTGPKPVLDHVKQAEIFAALAQGASRRAAARYVGCSHNTIANTAKRDAGFAERLRKTETQCELDALSQINASFGKSWRAAAWYLERTRPQDYEKVQLRQPTFDQISEFWDECAGIVLQGVPDEHRGPVREKLAKASEKFSRRINIGASNSTRKRQAGASTPLGLPGGQPQPPDANALPQGRGSLEAERALSDSLEAGVTKEFEKLASIRRSDDREELHRIAREVVAIRTRRNAFRAAWQAGDDSEEPDWVAQLEAAKVPKWHLVHEAYAVRLDRNRRAGSPSGGSRSGGNGEKKCESEKKCDGVKACEGVKGAGQGAAMTGAAVLVAILLACGAILSAAPLSRVVYPRAKVAETTSPAGDVFQVAVVGRTEARLVDAGSMHAESATATMDRVRTMRSAGINPAAHAREPANVDQQPQTPPGAWSKLRPISANGTRFWPESRVLASASG